MELRLFFREFIPITPRDELWDGGFLLIYNSNGGITESDLVKMSKKKFLWYLKRLSDEKKKENDQYEKAKAKAPTRSSKYLGR